MISDIISTYCMFIGTSPMYHILIFQMKKNETRLVGFEGKDIKITGIFYQPSVWSCEGMKTDLHGIYNLVATMSATISTIKFIKVDILMLAN